MKAKKKSFMTFAICGALALLGAIVGLTSAWFTSSVSVAGTIKTGVLKVKIGTPATIAVTGAVPGQKVVDTIKILNDGSTINSYIRVQIVAGNDVALTIGSAGNKWYKDTAANVWYYGNNTALEAVTPTALNTGLTLSAITIDGTVGNTAQGKTVNITIYVDAIQAEYADAGTPAKFDAKIARH
ncbi:MAG: hypothetical protein MR862_04065 [Clostridia bacterium]|nr:hypothetical protein [Clostridia bacterium]